MHGKLYLPGGSALLAGALLAVSAGAQQSRADWIRWIPLCGKCPAPSIVSRSMPTPNFSWAKPMADGRQTESAKGLQRQAKTE